MYSRCLSRFVAYFLGHLSRSSFSQFFLVFSTESFVTTCTDIRSTLVLPFLYSLLSSLSLPVSFSSKRDSVSRSFCVRLYFYPLQMVARILSLPRFGVFRPPPSITSLFRWHAFRPLQSRVWTGLWQVLRAKERTVLVAMQRTTGWSARGKERRKPKRPGGRPLWLLFAGRITSATLRGRSRVLGRVRWLLGHFFTTSHSLPKLLPHAALSLSFSLFFFLLSLSYRLQMCGLLYV